MKDERYKKLEGLLYSYKELPLKKRNCEIDLKISPTQAKEDELEIINLTMQKIENIMEIIRIYDEVDFDIIHYRYIKHLDWIQVEELMNMSISHMCNRRTRLFKEKLICLM